MVKNLELPLCLVIPEAAEDFAGVSEDKETHLKAAQWCGKCGVRLACYTNKVINTPSQDLVGELWAGIYFNENGEQRQILDVEHSTADLYEQAEVFVSSLRESLVNTKTQYYGRHDRLTLQVTRRLEGIYERDWKYPEVQELCRRMIIAFMRHPQLQTKEPVIEQLENVYAALNSYFESEIDAMY